MSKLTLSGVGGGEEATAKSKNLKGTTMDYYFVIHSTPDGVYIERFTEEEMIKELAEMTEEALESGSQLEFYTDMPTALDAANWEDKILIIKGRIVTPTPREVTIRYDLE